MTKQIQSLVSSALTAAHAYGDAIAKLRTTLSGQVSTEVRAVLLPYIGAYYAVPVLALTRGEGEGFCEYTNRAKTKRRVAADVDAVEVKGYAAAVKALQRMTKDIVGDTAERTVAEEVKLTKAQRAAIHACMELGITMKLYGQGVALLK